MQNWNWSRLIYVHIYKTVKTVSSFLIIVFLPSVRYQSKHVSSQDPASNYDPTHNGLTENGFGVIGPGSGTVQSQNLERVIRLSDKQLFIHTTIEKVQTNWLSIQFLLRF